MRRVSPSAEILLACPGTDLYESSFAQVVTEFTRFLATESSSTAVCRVGWLPFVQSSETT